MQKGLLILILIFCLSCEKHFEKEQLVHEIISSPDSFEVLLKKHDVDLISDDSVDVYSMWSDYFKSYNCNFHIIEKNGYFYDNFEDTDGDQVYVVKIEKINGAYGVDFNFTNKDGKWKLKDFGLFGSCIYFNEKSGRDSLINSDSLFTSLN